MFDQHKFTIANNIITIHQLNSLKLVAIIFLVIFSLPLIVVGMAIAASGTFSDDTEITIMLALMGVAFLFMTIPFILGAQSRIIIDLNSGEIRKKHALGGKRIGNLSDMSKIDRISTQMGTYYYSLIPRSSTIGEGHRITPFFAKRHFKKDELFCNTIIPHIQARIQNSNSHPQQHSAPFHNNPSYSAPQPQNNQPLNNLHQQDTTNQSASTYNSIIVNDLQFLTAVGTQYHVKPRIKFYQIFFGLVFVFLWLLAAIDGLWTSIPIFHGSDISRWEVFLFTLIPVALYIFTLSRRVAIDADTRQLIVRKMFVSETRYSLHNMSGIELMFNVNQVTEDGTAVQIMFSINNKSKKVTLRDFRKKDIKSVERFVAEIQSILIVKMGMNPAVATNITKTNYKQR